MDQEIINTFTQHFGDCPLPTKTRKSVNIHEAVQYYQACFVECSAGGQGDVLRAVIGKVLECGRQYLRDYQSLTGVCRLSFHNVNYLPQAKTFKTLITINTLASCKEGRHIGSWYRVPREILLIILGKCLMDDDHEYLLEVAKQEFLGRAHFLARRASYCFRFDITHKDCPLLPVLEEFELGFPKNMFVWDRKVFFESAWSQLTNKYVK